MAEKSIFWTTGATGDGATAYTQAEAIRWMRQMWIADNAEEGVHKGYENELEPTGVATPVAVDTGAALIYGFPYWNTASVDVAIPTPSVSTRIDRIVLRADWTAQTTRITRIAGTEGAGVPAIVQTDGVTWDLKICQASITTGGTITVTDERDWLRPNIAVDENMLDASVAGDGITGGDGTPLATDPDGTMLENSGGKIQIKDAGVGVDQIAAAIAGDALVGGAGSALDVNVDDSTIETNADALRVKALGIDTAELAADSVDDTKAGDRVPQFYRRQGGSATVWSAQGTTTYTPGAVRMQAGSIRWTGGSAPFGTVSVTFPVAFGNVPIVNAIAFGFVVTAQVIVNVTTTLTASGMDLVWTDWGAGNHTQVDILWFAVGPE